MRPAGVWERVKELRADEERHATEHPEQALRRELTWFIHGCALLAFDDLPTSGVVETYRTVLARLEDPSQLRIGSVLERASLECVERLREPLAEVAAAPDRRAGRDELLAKGPLLRVPPMTLMGRVTNDVYFPMSCLNAAGSCQDGIISAYHAAALITSVGYFKPTQDPDLVVAMRELRERYEDQPQDRAGVASEIADLLETWLARGRATWPVCGESGSANSQ